MLMDMFYENVKLENKKRIHFNAFMLDVHKRKLQIRIYYVFTKRQDWTRTCV